MPDSSREQKKRDREQISNNRGDPGDMHNGRPRSPPRQRSRHNQQGFGRSLANSTVTSANISRSSRQRGDCIQVPCSKACDERRRFDIDRFNTCIEKCDTKRWSIRHIRSASKNMDAFGMISSAFNPSNLKTAFLLRDKDCSVRSRDCLSINSNTILQFRDIMWKTMRKPNGYLLMGHLNRVTQSLCEFWLGRPSFRVNYKMQAMIPLMFHPCIGCPGKDCAKTTEYISRVLSLRITKKMRHVIFGWLNMMPIGLNRSMIRRWIAHISIQWMLGTELELSLSFRWTRELRNYFVERTQWFPPSTFYSSVISKSFHTNRYLLVRRKGIPQELQYQRRRTPPKSFFIGHEYLLDAAAKTRLMRQESILYKGAHARHLSSPVPTIERSCMQMAARMPASLNLYVRRAKALPDAFQQLKSAQMTEDLLFNDAYESAINDAKSVGPRERSIELERTVREELPKQIAMFRDVTLEMPVRISFLNEAGLDEGGLTRTFYSIISKQAVYGEHSLFSKRSASSTCVWFPKSDTPIEFFEASGCYDHLKAASRDVPNADGKTRTLPNRSVQNYELFGILMGLCLVNRSRMDIQFPDIFYQFILSGVEPGMTEKEKRGYIGTTHKIYPCEDGVENLRSSALWESVSPGAMKQIDPELERGFDQLIQYTGNDLADVFQIDHMVTVANGRLDVPLYSALCKYTKQKSTHTETESSTDAKVQPTSDGDVNSPGNAPSNSAVEVCQRTKLAYVRAYRDFVLFRENKARMNAIRTGFWRVMCRYVSIRVCDAEELKLMLCGVRSISAPFICASLRFDGFSSRSLVPVWLVEILHEMNPRDIRLFYTFVTGSESLSCGGPGDEPIYVQKNTSEDERLPSSHTCFNQLLLPDYGSKAKLKEKLYIAIRQCKDFGLL